MLCDSLTSQKTRRVLLFQVWGRGGLSLKCFLSLCAPRVTKSTTDGEQDKRSGDWSFLPTPLRSWHWHSHWHMWYLQPPVSWLFAHWLSGHVYYFKCISNVKNNNSKKKKRKDIQRLNVKFGGGQRLAYGKAGFNSSSGFRRRASKERYIWNDLAAERTAVRYFPFGSLGIFRGLRVKKSWSESLTKQPHSHLSAHMVHWRWEMCTL